ncbi:uncharacterized protein F4822DRAFT_407520 [Hypoxylon trugodes]|uniref:uncharacterized protein n=1 Tax=Hypoxylon trugodes TaxID=326681 RepID=UPI00219B88EC|nr:uncharacterized protein F4822DRAFT_407520 [Hypoxylon trugodes]KAI1387766.1 hypothetical protein F4822DRAFT_407520 [Hypoxylon trugodes]
MDSSTFPTHVLLGSLRSTRQADAEEFVNDSLPAKDTAYSSCKKRRRSEVSEPDFTLVEMPRLTTPQSTEYRSSRQVQEATSHRPNSSFQDSDQSHEDPSPNPEKLPSELYNKAHLAWWLEYLDPSQSPNYSSDSSKADRSASFDLDSVDMAPSGQHSITSSATRGDRVGSPGYRSTVLNELGIYNIPIGFSNTPKWARKCHDYFKIPVTLTAEAHEAMRENYLALIKVLTENTTLNKSDPSWHLFSYTGILPQSDTRQANQGQPSGE